MTEAEAVEAITQRWIDAWATLHPGDLAYTFDGETFDATGRQTWARITVMHSDRERVTQGTQTGRKHRAMGRVYVSLFGAVDAGRRPLALLADDVRKVFESRLLTSPSGDEPLRLRGGASRESPTDRAWLMQTITIPFEYYETT